MWIRTQNKRGRVNLNNVVEIGLYAYKKKNEIKEKYPTDIRYYTGTDWGVLGGYSSEEKALKVLDMIEKAYVDSIGGNVYEHSVFHMPADEEVNV